MDISRFISKGERQLYHLKAITHTHTPTGPNPTHQFGLVRQSVIALSFIEYCLSSYSHLLDLDLLWGDGSGAWGGGGGPHVACRL